MQSLLLPELGIPDHVTDTPLGKVIVPGVSIPERMVMFDPNVIGKLIDAARLATETAYNNYPGALFPVGAACIMADDGEEEIFSAANCENAILNSGMCAERALLHYVVSKGFRRIKYIAVSTANSKKENIRLRSPCGLCRQTIAEFADDNTLIIIDHQQPGILADIVDMDRLLPYRYKLEL